MCESDLFNRCICIYLSRFDSPKPRAAFKKMRKQILYFVSREVCTPGVWHTSELISEKLQLWVRLLELLVHHRIYDLF